MKIYNWLQFGVLLLLLSCCWHLRLNAQVRIQIKVVEASVLTHNDCDGRFSILSPNSDYTFEFRAEDNTLGNENNNPFAAGILGGVNYVFKGGENGPWIVRAPSGDINPNNGLFFDYEYVCPTDVPSQIKIDWRAYENDVYDISSNPISVLGNTVDEDLSTPPQSTTVVPTTIGTTTIGPFTATGTGGGCGTQEYSITFEITVIPITVTPLPDDICNAIPLTIANGANRYIWCADCSLESNEPNQGDVTNNSSRWFYFIAPASGRVRISTDFGGTDFGTYMDVYHAADGANCTTGLHPIRTNDTIKDKFEYLSWIESADAGVNPLNNLGGNALQGFNDCANTISANPLIAGEVYYVQLTTDDPDQGGYIEIEVKDLNTSGTPSESYDIPCQAVDLTTDAQSDTVRTYSGGQSESANLAYGCATGRETGNPHSSSDPEQYQAYDYDHPATNNNTVHESVWTSFTAANSGRIYFEGNVSDFPLGIEVNQPENTALFGYDPRFAPGTPTDYSCANLRNLAAAEGGSFTGGPAPTAIIMQQCLEPGYQYYAMVDPSSVSAGDAYIWMYDPSVDDPLNNPPGNDILCLALNNPVYEIPVQLVGQPTLPFQTVAGTNEHACIETLAGEPLADSSSSSNRADQTVWHYFTVPPSGVVEIKLRAYIGLNELRYAIYPLLNGTTCYGGLAQPQATFTSDGTRAGSGLVALEQGLTDFNGTTINLCCLNPGDRCAIQLDGGAPGDEGQYIIEYINEVEVYAGDAQFETEMGDIIAFNSNDTALICFGDSIFPTVMLDGLGQTTTSIPSCQDLGFIMHNTMPIPDTIANIGFTYIDSTRAAAPFFVNNTNGTGSFGHPSFNQVYYVSALADKTEAWGDLTCSSASSENGVPVVFLRPITLNNSYDANNCIITFSALGGVPEYNASLFTWVATNTLGDTITGTATAGQSVNLPVSVADMYTIVVSDQKNCSASVVVNATLCNDLCIVDPVIIAPNPRYTCLPGDTTATVTLDFSGGYPSINNSGYTITVIGSSVLGANGTFAVTSSVPYVYVFPVQDGDNWQVILTDSSLCSDTLAGTFMYNLANCPNYCTLNPVVLQANYNCFSNGSALVEIEVGGGLPAVDGSSYSVNISGSTVLGQTFNNIQLSGNIGATSLISFLVNDGDTWFVNVIDANNCADTLMETYLFNNASCNNLCQLLPVKLTPNPIDSSVYSCNADGTAEVRLNLDGGDPVLNGTSYTVHISGSTVVGQSGTFTAGIGAYTFTVNDGDSWQVILIDANNCADTTMGTFIFNEYNCDICSIFPPTITHSGYTCNANGIATVEITLEGGMPSYNGSDYFVTVSGSTAGGNVSAVALSGTIGGGTTYTFPVADGNNWVVAVTDTAGCMSSLGGTFLYNSTNCSGMCDSLPIRIQTSDYSCNLDETANVSVSLSGGKPDFDGSNYFITITGLSTGNNTLNLPLSGNIGGTVDYSFTVGDGDIWQIFVSDAENCLATVTDTFTWNATNCGNICNSTSYTPVLINGGLGTISYDCDGEGAALLNLELSGGLPAVRSLNNGYTATITINGSTRIEQIAATANFATLLLELNDGDDWEVLVSDGLGCNNAILGAVFNTIDAVAETDVNFEILIGEPATLIGTNSRGNITSYEWTAEGNITDPTAATTTVFPLQNTVYKLEVRDVNDCVDTDSVEVLVGACVPDHAGFTPNADGTNDLWEIPCMNLLEGDLEVYNRWGQLVYKKEHYDNSWNGTHFQTQLVLPDATYYYVLKVVYPEFSEAVIHKGTVTIIR